MAHSRSSPSSAKRPSFRETITVLVGPEKSSFTVHADIIRTRSPFFDAAIARWKTAGEPIVLEDDKPEVFEAYLQCIYMKEVPHEETEEGCPDFESLTAVYALADKLGDLGTANATIDKFIEVSDKLHRAPNDAECCSAFAITPENSPLRRLLVDYYIHEVADDQFESNIRQLPLEMAYSVAIAVRALTRQGSSIDTLATDRPKCHYHQHNETFPVCENATSKQ